MSVSRREKKKNVVSSGYAISFEMSWFLSKGRVEGLNPVPADYKTSALNHWATLALGVLPSNPFTCVLPVLNRKDKTTITIIINKK